MREERGTMMTLNLACGNDGAMLTTEHAASSYGIPVLVIRGQVYGLRDPVPADPEPTELAWMEYASGEQFVICRAHKLGLPTDAGLIAKFLGPAGLHVETPTE